jgi:hypothetical protein
MTQSNTHITASGGLISAAFIEHIRELATRQRGVEPESFTLPWSPAPRHPAALEETIASAWELLLERWDAVREDLPMMDVSQLRARWLLPLFELLDFQPVYLRADTVLDEAGKLRYPLSHRGWEGDDAPVLHTVPPTQALDERMTTSAGSARGIKSKSPHDMLQAFLNASPDDRWAILSNGFMLRLLRDYHHTFTKGYVQFDLESMFETRNYGDFRALYRMGHASRFVPPQTSEVSETSEVLAPLEQFYKDALATGIKVGEDLRGQVRQAIETLGNGFLDGALIRQLQDDPALCRRYYGEILHVIYRILFLLFAEQRGMLPHAGAPLEDLYREGYSITALRARAEGDLPRADHFTDLWAGLRATFRMVRQGAPELGVFGYDGMLFDDDQIPLLSGLPTPDRPHTATPLTCANSDLLGAIRALTLIQREGVLQRISYADLGVEELGAIYESLLDYTPRVTSGPESVEGREIPPHSFLLDPRGAERKTTGSYYTHPSLVDELIKSALLPVARDRLATAGLPVVDADTVGEITAGLLTDYHDLSAAQRAAGEVALLALKVCDPAAGSGHFLVKVDNTLGAELARVRTGDEYPDQDEVQAARRDVLAHCIYAVDLNPMAVELCKVSLWINASVRDQPLNFLDHHIKCGNSLIGTVVRPGSSQAPDPMAEGIPYQAFDQTLTGNDRKLANRVRKRNRKERGDFEKSGAYQPALFRVQVYELDGRVWQTFHQIAVLAEAQPKMARERYAAYQSTAEHQARKLVADTWTAAFFWPLTRDAPPPLTFNTFQALKTQGAAALSDAQRQMVAALATRYRFFHWHIEFPEVFRTKASEDLEGSGGFDVVLGNPPWERIKLQEKEFFADKDPAIVNARTASARRKLIKKLSQTDPALHAAYVDALRESEAMSHFWRESGRYPLSAMGDINTYQVFSGLVRQIVGQKGRVGIVVPSGIATDYYNQDYFSTVIEGRELVSFYDFENRAGLFPGTHRSYKFALLTLAGSAVDAAEYAFFLHTTEDLADPIRRFALSREDVALMNPNTHTVPVFRTRHDAELTRKLYRAAPVLVNEETGKNPWGVSFLRMFDMTNDSGLFRTREQLEAEGFVLQGNRFVQGEELWLPLYEGKMFMPFDHRFADVIVTDNVARSGQPDLATLEDHLRPCFVVTPRFWVNLVEVNAKLDSDYENEWLLGFKNVTAPTNERTFLATILPVSAVGNSVPLILPKLAPGARHLACLASNLSCMVFDFAARQKMGNVNLNFYLVEQLPILTPDHYTSAMLDYIVPCVVELSYTAWDLGAFARDVLDEVGQETWARWFKEAPVHTSPPPAWAPAGAPPPFVWDEVRRARLRAELDALYAYLYGLSREELAYVLDTFPIVRRKDEARFGEYRTKRMVLEAFENRIAGISG